MLNNSNNKAVRRQAGFSLIELMLAMLIGIIIIGGVMSLYLTTRDTQRASQDQLQLVTDARFVIETLAYDLRHAGSWGSTNQQQGVDCQKNYDKCSNGGDLPKATNDCSDWDYIDMRRPVYGADDDNSVYGGTCANTDYKAGTDILQVRYADSTVVGDQSAAVTSPLKSDTVYLRGNALGGKLFEYSGSIPAHDGFYKWESNAINDLVTKNHEMVSNIYYISEHTESGDNIPSLRRGYLKAGPEMDDEVLISGVEDMQIQYGVPSLATNAANTKSVLNYSDADPAWTDEQWQRISAVKVFVLLRSDKKDREDEIKENKTYNYAGKTFTSNDGYKRFLISSVIELKNRGMQ